MGQPENGSTATNTNTTQLLGPQSSSSKGS